jgi:hypothetical protein
MMTIKFVKLPNDDERQRLAASNNVNNNVSTDFSTRPTSQQRSNGMASKEIQTSAANLLLSSPPGNSTGSTTVGRKFERGRDRNRQRSPPAAVAMEGITTAGTVAILSPPVPRCSNINCRHNVPSAAASTSSKRLVCLCGNPMTIISSEKQLLQQQQQQQLQQHQPNLIHRRQGEKSFLGQSDDTSLVTCKKLQDPVSS